MLMLALLLVAVALCNACTKTQVRCPGVGTFSKQGPYKRWRLPKCPDSLSVNMILYTRSNRGSGKAISARTIPSVFRSGKRTIVLVHGYMQRNEWFADMKSAFLTKGDFNVITVDWDSKNLFYPQSASDTRTVGAALALVMRHLVDNNRITRPKLWCIGQSLGAHVCGNAGKRYRFGRITGLDPAGPKFKDNTAAGLVSSSGDFVDVIHSGANLLGMMTPVGHVDFYPNGALYLARQMCHHRRGLKYFVDTINGKSTCYTNRKCSSSANIPGSCRASTNQQLGYYSETHSGRGLYYLTTNVWRPYC